MSFFDFTTAVSAFIFCGFMMVCIIRIIRLGMDHKLKLEKIRHGYPLDEAETARPPKRAPHAAFAEERLQ